MDSGTGNLGSEIPQVGKGLVELLRETLCPSLIHDGDMIIMASPWEENNYKIGVYLYDIQDRSIAASSAVMVNEKEKRFPPKAVELSYMIFCNENSRFGGIRREQIHIQLNEVIRIVYDNSVIETEDGEAVQLSFARETIDFKIRLWGGFNLPLQPAVYVRAVPVLIESGRTSAVVRVGERDYRTGRKEQAEKGII